MRRAVLTSIVVFVLLLCLVRRLVFGSVRTRPRIVRARHFRGMLNGRTGRWLCCARSCVARCRGYRRRGRHGVLLGTADRISRRREPLLHRRTRFDIHRPRGLRLRTRSFIDRPLLDRLEWSVIHRCEGFSPLAVAPREKARARAATIDFAAVPASLNAHQVPALAVWLADAAADHAPHRCQPPGALRRSAHRPRDQ